MEKEEIKNIVLFVDTILAITLSLLTVSEYLKYRYYQEMGIYGVAFWTLYLITTLAIVATLFSEYYNKKRYSIISTYISSIFLFITAISISLVFIENIAKVWAFLLLCLIYIVSRAYVYLRLR